ncbi:MAG: SAF domain-containing protein [Acidimicrobiia bacterium]
MARTMFRPAEQVAEAKPPAMSPVSVSRPTRRRPSWVLIGSLLVGLAALLGAWVFAATSNQVSVMVAAHDIEPGEVIDASDLSVVEIGASNDLRAIQSSQQELILGRAARGPIPGGTVLNTDLFVDPGSVVPDGKVVVGAALDAGAVPSSRLRAGDAVNVLAAQRTTAGQQDVTAAPVATLLASGTVWTLEATGSTSAGLWVSLVVPANAEGAVVQAAADGLLRLSLVADR